MQINLIPKTRELEQKKNAISTTIFFAGVVILAASAIVTFVLFSINFARKAEVKGLDKKIEEKQSEVAKYDIVSQKSNYIISGVDGIRTVLSERKDWNLILTELQNLMPRESYITEIQFPEESKITFKTRTISASKVAEFIESLRNYEIEIPETPSEEEENTRDLSKESIGELEGSSNQNSDENSEAGSGKLKRVKLFSEVKISQYSKNVEESAIWCYFEVEATYTEDLWTKNK